MTTQEFVKQEVEAASNQMFPIGNEHESKMIARQEYRSGMAYGLTKGLEIGLGFRKWRREYKLKFFVPNEEKLLSIYLTEKYGK